MVNFTLFWSQFSIKSARPVAATPNTYSLSVSESLSSTVTAVPIPSRFPKPSFFQHIMTGCDLSASLCDKPYSLTQHSKVILYLIFPRLRTRHGAARARSDCPTLRHNCCAQAIILPVRLPLTQHPKLPLVIFTQCNCTFLMISALFSAGACIEV